MLIIENLLLLREYTRRLHREDKHIALVPTMGNLHDGHMRLVDEAKIRSDVVIVSIFVNPMQFDQTDDLARYPKTLQEDYDKLSKSYVDCAFSPNLEDVYPNGIKDMTYVEIPGISTILEGNSRPGHFRGVSTIISKLFNLVQPDLACFGEKDFQQLALIRKMVVDLNYNVDIISVPIARAEDGLALSSRNSRLTADQRKIAPGLSNVINKIAEWLQEKELVQEEILSLAKRMLEGIGFHNQDLKIRDADTLLELTKTSQRAVILASAWLGRIRLIDNKVIDLKVDRNHRN